MSISDNVPRIALVLALLLFAPPWAGVAESAGVLATHYFDISEKIDDNVDYDGFGDLVTRIQSRLDLTGGDERANWRMNGGFDYITHKELSDRDRTNRDLNLELTRNFTSRLRGALNGSVGVDHVTESTLEEFAIVIRPTRRTTFTVTPSMSYQIDEKNSLRGEGAFQRRISVSPDVADESSKRGLLSWTRVIDETKSFSATGSYLTDELVFDGRTVNYDLYYMYLSLAYSWSEDLDFSFSLGPSRTETKTDFTVGPDRETAENSYYVSGRADWRRERGDYSLELTREQSQTALGRSTTKLRIVGVARYRWTERLNSSLRLSYTHTGLEDEGTGESDGELYKLRPGIGYKLTEDMDLSFSYEYSEVDTIGAGSVEQRNVFMVQIVNTFSKLFD